jgi:hypothetical protein
MIFSCLATVMALESDPSNSYKNDYKRMLEWNFSQYPTAIPQGGINLKRDGATWILESGQVWLMEPATEGIRTGMLFKGQGRFEMNIPDPVERDQFHRFTKKKIINKIEEPFTKLVIRTSENFLADLVRISETENYLQNPLAKDRHENWLKLAKMDVDARVIAGLLNRDDEYLCIDMDTINYGWLTYIFDKLQQEEIQLQKCRNKLQFLETWVSLDRESDRTKSGRPSALRRDPIDITHLEIEADLTRWKLLTSLEMSGALPVETGNFQAIITFNPLISGYGALQLDLHPWAKVNSVSTMDGRSLSFIRDPIGKRFLSVQRDIHDSSLLILLDEPLVKNQERKLKVDYTMKFGNFVSGGSWYPHIRDNVNDDYNVKFTLKLHEKYDVLAVGKLQKPTVSDHIKTMVWITEIPTKMYGFTIGKRFEKQRINLKGTPEVVSFGIDRAGTTGDMVKNVAIDVAKSLHFYQWYFDMRFPVNKMRATYIDSDHGQAFYGLLHLSKYTYFGEHPGASELFRAHEAAHQMWGHMVGWKTYRDQWLSEALAEYSAMLFIKTTMPDSGYFEEILKVYANELIGSYRAGMSKFARPWNISQVRKYRDELGPIDVGVRASTAEAPNGYFIQIYDKGALVLHMLRVLLRNSTGSDELFRSILQDFLHTYAWKAASTEDFKNILEKHSEDDWSWFFDQWINKTAIPTYSWSYEINPHPSEKDKFEVVINVKQSDVPENFKMVVPIQLKLKGGTVKQFNLPVDEAEKTFHLTTDKKPSKLIFNPNYSVLAKVKEK